MELLTGAVQRGTVLLKEARQGSKAGPPTLPHCEPPVQCTTLLIGVPYAELREVHHGRQALVAQGPFAISSSVASRDGGSEAVIRAEVGHVSWAVLPLSQTLRVGELTFVFSTPALGVYYAVTLGSQTPPEVVGTLEAVLEHVSLLRDSERLLADPDAKAGEAVLAEEAEYRHRWASGVRKGSSYVARGLLATAACASGAMEKVVSSRLDKVEPREAPVQVSPALQKRLEQTAAAAKWTAKAGSKAVEGVAKLGAKVAGRLLKASGVDKKLASGAAGAIGGQRQRSEALREVSRAAMEGWGEVHASLEAAGHLVLTSARDNTARVVDRKYGAEAGAASVVAMNAVGHTADALLTLNEFGVRALAKATAKQTAKDALQGLGQGGVPSGQRPAVAPAR